VLKETKRRGARRVLWRRAGFGRRDGSLRRRSERLPMGIRRRRRSGLREPASFVAAPTVARARGVRRHPV